MNRKQKILIALITLLPLIIYVIWGFFKLPIEGGSTINLGAVQLTNGLSDVLVWTLSIMLPVALTVALVAVSRNWRWLKRLLLPLLLCAIIISLNIAIGVHIFHSQITPL